MKALIRLTVAGLSIFMVYAGCQGAHAKALLDEGNNKKIFFDENGKKLTPLEANKLAEQDKLVLACTPQDYVCNNRTGACRMKNSR